MYRMILVCIFFLATWLHPSSLMATNPVNTIELNPKSVVKAFSPRRIGLFVGVGEFADKKWRSLNFPKNDVQELSKFVKSHNGSDRDDFSLHLNENATLEQVKAALKKLEALNTSSQDIVIVYFSSHGTLAPKSAFSREMERFVVLQDTKFDHVQRTALPVAYLEASLSRLRSQKKALILALCHAGSGKSQLPGSIQQRLASMKSGFFKRPLHQVSSAMMVLSASSWGEPAHEDRQLGHDIYTYFLIKGLRQWDSDQDGAVSLFEAHEYARSRTYDFTNGQQTPSALINMRGKDPIILNGTPKEKAHPMIYADNHMFRGFELQINGQSKGTLWEPKKVPSGPVRIAFVDPANPDNPVVDHQVVLQKNELYAVSELLDRSPSVGMVISLGTLPLTRDDRPITAFGLDLHAERLLGSYWTVSAGFQTAKWHSHNQRIKENWQAENYQLTLGKHMRFSDQWSHIVSIQTHWLRLHRQIDSESYYEPRQRLSLWLSAFGYELQFAQATGPSFMGIYLNLFPFNNLMSAYSQSKNSRLQLLAGGLHVGLRL